MSWNLPKLLPKLPPNKPSVALWLGLALLSLTVTTTVIYILHINGILNSNKEYLTVYSAIILVMLFIFGLRIFIFELKLSFVQTYNAQLTIIRNNWKKWGRKGLRISYLHRVSPFSPNEIDLLSKNELIINPHQKYSFEQDSDSINETKADSHHDTMSIALNQLLKPFNQIKFDFLKYTPVNVFFVTSQSDYDTYVQTQNYQNLSSPISEILSYFDKLEFQLLKTQIIPSAQLQNWLSKTIDNQSTQHALLFFLENNSTCTETYSWWYIEPEGVQANSTMQPLFLRRPIEVPRNKINYALSVLNKFQLNAASISEAWINGSPDDDLTLQLSICGQALSYGFANNQIFNSNKIYGKTNTAAIGALVGLLKEKNAKESLIVNLFDDSIVLFSIAPIHKNIHTKG